jgi:hypothetical protein
MVKRVVSSLVLAGGLLAGAVVAERGTEKPSSVNPNAPALPVSASAAGIGKRVTLPARPDIDGKMVGLPLSGAKFTVVALVGTTCPLSQKVSPTLASLEDRYASRGVKFTFVDPSPAETPAELRAVRERLDWDGPVVHDPEQRMVKPLSAATTTETVVLDAQGKVVYRGAVDDQYAVGASLPQPRNRFLADALDALLAGKSPKVAATSAPGCLLPTPSAAAPVPTYHGKIQHVVQKHCVPCHRKDGVGPFVLDSYEAVKARSSMINAVVDKGVMPPWFAAKGTGPWRDDPTIPDADKAALAAWASGGTPKGDPKQAPKPPVFADSWMLGKPDVVLEMPEPVAVKATGTMAYVDVDIPTGFTEDKWIQKIEVQPGNRAVVHHVLVFIRRPDSGGNRFAVLGQSAEEIRGFFGAYAPGGGGLSYPDGLAKRVPAGSKLRFQLHYTPNGTATTDRSRIGLTFSKAPVQQEVHTSSAVNVWFSIPPGADNHEVIARLPAPKDAVLLSLFPHAHVRGKAARYELARADGKQELLLDVPRYDFNWQLGYTFVKPVEIKAGDELVYRAWYDNSTKNASNPDPSRRVGWGEQTYDEMHLGYFEYIVPGEKPGGSRSGGFGSSGGGFGGLIPGGGGNRSGAGRAGMLSRMFEFLDSDRDGMVSEAEAGRFWGAIQLADTDKDGKVSQDEARKMLGGGAPQRP